MTTLVLIPSGQTTWQQEGRLVGNADLPLSDAGRQQVDNWAKHLKDAPPQVLYGGTGGAADETIKLLGLALKVKGKLLADFDEVSVGLWQGLRLEEIKQRYPKVWKQWHQQPQMVCPPEGEILREAQQRLRAGIDTITRKHNGKKIGLVLGQLAWAIVRADREGKAPSQIWPLSQQPDCLEYLVEEAQETAKQSMAE